MIVVVGLRVGEGAVGCSGLVRSVVVVVVVGEDFF